MYKCVIIGAGSIGALKPDKFDSPLTENILTHAHAITAHSKFELTGFVDTDSKKSKQACLKWSALFYDNEIKRIPKDTDVIIVTTPTSTHHKVLTEVIKLQPKIIIAEKPFTDNSAQAMNIIGKAQEAGIPIAINYIRRYEANIKKLAGEIKSGIYGAVYYCKVAYCRGFKHDGSHAMDLMCNFFGDYSRGQILGLSINDRDAQDRTRAAHLQFAGCHHVFFCPVDGRDISMFEIEIMTKTGKIVLSSHSRFMQFYPKIKEPDHGDFSTVSTIETRIETSLNTALMKLYDNIAGYLDGTDELLCTAQDALEVHAIYEDLK